MVNEKIRQHHRTELQPVIENALFRQKLGDMTAKASDRALFDGDQCIMTCGEAQDQVVIQRFGETGIGHCRHDATGLQCLACFGNLGQAGAERQDGDALTAAALAFLKATVA